MQKAKLVAQAVGLPLVLLLFFVSLELMGESLKLMGRDEARVLLSTTSNPFVGLFVGILATSLVQSSSTVTSIVVGLVAGGGLTVSGAIPFIMGANIGTSVTNTVVSLGHITRKDEFRRAMAGATVHDLFNLFATAVFFPLELMTGFLSKSALVLAEGVSGMGGATFLSPLHLLIEPITDYVVGLAQSSGLVVLVAGVVLLFVALRYLVVLLKQVVLGRVERFLHTYLFGTVGGAFLFGTVMTIAVQSSSVTTSLIVPLVGAGIVSVAQIFPFVLGANVGTTVTALLAALVLAGSGEPGGLAALEVAFVHLCFNIYGVAFILPFPRVRELPIRLAEKLGDVVARRRAYALGYIGLVFFVIPLLFVIVSRAMAALVH